MGANNYIDANIYSNRCYSMGKASFPPDCYSLVISIENVMKKKKKEIQDDQSHILNLDQERYLGANIIANTVLEDYKISHTIVPFATDQLRLVNDSIKTTIADICSIVPSKITLFHKDSLRTNILGTIHSPISSLQDSLIVRQSGLISSIANTVKDSFAVDINQGYASPFNYNSAFDRVVGFPVP